MELGYKGLYFCSQAGACFFSRFPTQTAFFAAGMNTIGLVWIYFRLPEPSGLSYAEIDKLFEERIPARKFKHHKVTAVEAEDVGVVEVKN